MKGTSNTQEEFNIETSEAGVFGTQSQTGADQTTASAENGNTANGADGADPAAKSSTNAPASGKEGTPGPGGSNATGTDDLIGKQTDPSDAKDAKKADFEDEDKDTKEADPKKEDEDSAKEKEKTEQESDTQAGTEVPAEGGAIASYLPAIGIGAAVLLAAGIAAAGRKARKKREREAQRQREAALERERQKISKGVKQVQEVGERHTDAYDKTAAKTQAEIREFPDTAEDLELPHGLYVSKVHHIGRRSSQQDSFGISQDGTRLDPDGKGVFAIVADGMGGLANGDEVSTRVTISMLEAFERQSGSRAGDQLLLSLLNKANADVNRMLGERGRRKSGSTAVAVLVRDDSLFWIAVGDSHIYLYRDGALMQINRDHVYSVQLDEMAARGEISAKSAAEDPQRRALTSFIGIGKLEKIDRNIRPLKLQGGDRILLMTDGVFGTLSDEEITAAMRLPVEESSVAIGQMIQSKNKETQDNYTALILEYR